MRILPMLLLAAMAAVGCSAPVDGGDEGRVHADPAPPFDLSDDDKTRLLFPALLEPDPAKSRCQRSRAGEPPPWLVEAATQSQCTAVVRAALQPSAATPATAQDRLTIGAVCDDVEAIKLALAMGADPNRRDSCGWTALVAAAAGHPQAVRTLLHAGARAALESLQGAWSRPPLLAALIARDAASARLLVNARAPVNVETAGRRSALMFAASLRDSELVQALLRRGADPCHTDSLGLTPATVARVYGNEAAVELLGKAAAKCRAPGPAQP